MTGCLELKTAYPSVVYSSYRAWMASRQTFTRPSRSSSWKYAEPFSYLQVRRVLITWKHQPGQPNVRRTEPLLPKLLHREKSKRLCVAQEPYWSNPLMKTCQSLYWMLCRFLPEDPAEPQRGVRQDPGGQLQEALSVQH